MIKADRIAKGDIIKVIAPASYLKDSYKIELGKKVIENLGYKLEVGDSCYEREGYLSGSDEVRANDINQAFKDKNVKMIIALRGGYGSARLLEKLDYKAIENNPKIFVGYSDITALTNTIYKKTALVTFHGPMLASDISINNTFTMDAFLTAITGKIKKTIYRLTPINSGDILGKIVGGNLSVICSLLNTKYDCEWYNKILFLEDIGEEPYKIDRMLYQLKLSGVFDKVKGVLLGDFTNCVSDNPHSFEVFEVLEKFFKTIKVPVYKDLIIGHNEKKITIPIGIKVKMSNNILSFINEGVT